MLIDVQLRFGGRLDICFDRDRYGFAIAWRASSQENGGIRRTAGIATSPP